MSIVGERRAADRFWSELSGELAGASRVGESALDPAGAATVLGPEPFFSDAPGEGWTVVAWPGAPFIGLQPDDLVVRRTRDGGWLAERAGDVDRLSVFHGRGRHVRRDRVVLRRVRQPEPALRMRRPDPPPVEDVLQPLVEVCGFFGPNNVRRTEAQIREAVVRAATGEWTAWHNGAAPRFESDRTMFGRLVGYYLAAVATLKPDALTAIQTTARGAVTYDPLLDAATTAAAGPAAAALATTLIAGAPAAPADGLAGVTRTALLRAREAFLDAGAFRAWSAVFVVACVRGAGISLGLEAVIAPGRRHVDPDVLLQAAVSHADYTMAARARTAARTPRRRGTYHAFAAADRAPRIGDIIVLDRGARSVAAIQTLAGLSAGITHGDIVVERQPTCVITIGGNLGDGSAAPTARQESARKRRYPIDDRGVLVRARDQLFTQEDNTGALPILPSTSTDALHVRSTARIFAILGPVEECAAVPGQPYRGGILT